MATMDRFRECAVKLKSGALHQGTSEFNECTIQPLPDSFSDLSKSLVQLNANPARLLTQVSAIESLSLSSRQVIDPQRNYQKMPLIVLSSGRHPLPPDLPVDVREQAVKYFQALKS